ncbi:MAG: phosphosulfolactate synthase [Chloroflexota bacterium]|nr:phosphosulfolactate synthase [Chloroflexota bacterium]
MPERAWAHVVEGLLTGRAQPPRKNGLTMVIDKGHGPAATADLLEMCGDIIDHWKCTFGTSAFVRADVLRRKLLLLASYGVVTYPGGTLLEVAVVRGSCQTFMQHAHKLGFNAVEISDGTIPLPLYRRRNIIRCAIDHGLTPITEVGKKDPMQQPTAIELAEQALQDFEWGAEWVTVESRESGTGIGIYDDNGTVRGDAVVEISERLGPLVERLIWEAPLKNQQTYLIQHFGPNVNLGNIPTSELLALESLRAGLRFETFSQIAAELERTGQWNPATLEEPQPLGSKRTKRIPEDTRNPATPEEPQGIPGRPQGYAPTIDEWNPAALEESNPPSSSPMRSSPHGKKEAPDA